MVPDKFNMVDMEGIDILLSFGDTVPGLYQKLVESIAQCRYQCLYNWYFDGVLIPPTYVEMVLDSDNGNILINANIYVTSEDVILAHGFHTGDVYTLDEVSTLGFPSVSNDVIMTATKIRPALFLRSGIKTFSGPNVDDMSGSTWNTGASSAAFQYCTSLESVSLPSLRTFYNSDYAFSGCSNLSTFDFDWAKCVSLGTGVFDGCEKLNTVTLVLPLLASNIWSSCFRNVTKLVAFDAYTESFYGTPQIRETSFAGTHLNKLILRGAGALSLTNINAFQNTPFASDGDGGTLYVQQSLISSYESATNWSTILGYANNRIIAIEGSVYETEYADGTPIT